MTGCLCPTSADHLPIIAGIQSAELCRKGATLSLAHRAMEPRHLLHSVLTCPPSANAQCLKSRHAFVLAAQQLISSSDHNRSVAIWVDYWWNAEWLENPIRLCTFIPNIGTHLEWPGYQEQRGSGLTASAPVSDVSALAYTNGVWPLVRPVSVAQKNKRWPCCPPMSNPSTSPWTAQPDSFWWWDNWLAPQHLPQDLVWPSSSL